MILKRYSGSVSWDEMKARTQAEREMNAALDIYPAGLPRNEITLEEAQRIASLGRYALEEAA